MTEFAKNLLKLLSGIAALAFLLSCSSTEKRSSPQAAKLTMPTLLPSLPQAPLFVTDRQNLEALARQDPIARLFDVYAMDSLYAPNAEVLSAVEKLHKQSEKDWVVAVGDYRGVRKTILHRKDCPTNQEPPSELVVPTSFVLEKLVHDFFKDNAAIFQSSNEFRIGDITDVSAVSARVHIVVSLILIHHGLPIVRWPDGMETASFININIQPVQGKAAICTVSFINPKLPENFSVTPVLSKNDAIRIAKQDYLLITQKKHIRELEDAKRMLEKAKDTSGLAYHHNEIEALTSHTLFKPGMIELGIGMNEDKRPNLVYRLSLGIKGLSGRLLYDIDATNGKVISISDRLRSLNASAAGRCGNTPEVIKGSW